MLNNLLGAKNVPAGIPKTIGEQHHLIHNHNHNHNHLETSYSESPITQIMSENEHQRAKARNALGNLLGARRKPPPPPVSPAQTPESTSGATSATTPTATSNAKNAASAASSGGQVPLNKDPRFEKFFRMLKVGMPLAHVKHAMQRDGLDPDLLDQDHNQPATNSTKTTAKRQPRQRKRNSLEPRRARFRWNKISNFFNESIWGDLSDDETIRSIDIDEEEFAELFQARAVETVKAQQRESIVSGGIQKKKQMGSAVRVIDAKRANNGGISLARIKMTFEEMSQTVDRMDTGILTAGQIENMIEYLPTMEEQEGLSEYMLNVETEDELTGRFHSLCECEKFMVSIMTVKFPKEKLDAMHFKLDFQTSLDAIAQDADLVDTACDELRNSARLKKLLGIVLDFGNKLNTAAQGPEDKANAYALDSLLKLKQTKAFDKKTTFLNYIVSIVERNDESLLGFAQDIQTVIKAERVSWELCVSAIAQVETQVENLRRMALYEAQAEPMNGNKKATPASIQVPEDEEFAILQSTTTGRFTMDALKQLAQLHVKVDATMEKFRNMLIYFGEAAGEGERPKRPHELFSIFSQFSRDFEEARPPPKASKSFR